VTVDGIMENTGNISMTYDGTWVAHPDLVPVAKEVFDRMMPQHSRRQALQKWHNALQSIGQTR
jgi:malate synthase